MFGWKRKADWKRSCAELQRQHDALAKQHDALHSLYDSVNQEIGELRSWIKGIEKRVGGLEDLYSGVAASHANEIKRVSDLTERADNLLDRIVAAENGREMLTMCVEQLQEQARQAGRKKVRRRDPQTGRFIWDYPEDLDQ